MDKAEAKRLITKELEIYRAKPYKELISMIDAEPVNYELTGPGEVTYNIEILAYWDSKKGGDVRIIGQIDDGGLSAFLPISDDFIKSPSDTFVGE